MQVEDIEYQLSPISLKQLGQLQRLALAYYKEEYLRTYSNNITILPRDRQSGLLEKKLEEVARWDIEDVPAKRSYSVANIKIEGDVLDWLNSKYPSSDPRPEVKNRFILEAALDNGTISPEEVQKMTGKLPIANMCSFDMWWITGCFEGMVSLLYESVRINHPRIKKSEIESWPMAKQMEAARIVESLTAPNAGNM